MRYTQPQSGPVQIDPDIGADFAWIAPIGKLVGPSTSNVSKTATKAGIAINSGYAIVAAPIPSMHTTTWTECGVALLDGTNQVYSLSSRATGQSVNFQPASNRVDLIIWTLVDVFITGTLPVGIVHYVVRRVGSAHTIWLNGRLYGTASSASTPVASSGILPAIGAQAGSGGNIGLTPLTATTGMLSVVRTQRALPDAQCLALSNNHWQIFRSPQRVMLAAAGGATYTLTAASGAFSLTGSASALRAARKLAVNSTAFTLTGSGVALSASRRLSANSGTFSLSGIAAALIASRKLAASTATFALVGGIAGLTTTRRLLASSGAFVLVGRTANLVYTPVPAPGSYTLTGATGSFAMNGSAAAFRVGRKLVGNQGSFALTGNAAGLACGRRLTASTGTFALGAGSAAFRVARRLAAGLGSYTLTGYAVGMTYTPIPTEYVSALMRYMIAADDRAFTIAPEDRTYSIGSDDRAYQIN